MSDSATVSEAKAAFERQRAYRFEFRNKGIEYRLELLGRLKTAIIEWQPKIEQALYDDLHRNSIETDLLDITPVLSEIEFTLKNLWEWSQSTSVSTPLALRPGHSEIRYEPKGQVLVLGTWNYPFQLCINPLVAALCAGNTVILKPSELAPQTSRIIKLLCDRTFAPEVVSVLEGGVETSEALLDLPFDHFFYTGSAKVGKIVAKAAAEHLASVTLELGGKSPVIVDSTADLEIAAEKIAWGKWSNSGQTCVAPDYLLVPKSKADLIVKYLEIAVIRLFSRGTGDFKASQDYCRLISEKHFLRIATAVRKSIEQGSVLRFGELPGSETEKFMPPMILSQVKGHHAIMQDEIFGPVLPILEYDDSQGVSEAIEFVNSRDKPLALYIFSQNRPTVERVLHETTSGGVVVNDVTLHLANPFLPFGGIGPSGQGRYHGQFGFKEFSHEKSVFYQSRLSGIKLMYPPYTDRTRKLLHWVRKLL